MFLYSLIYINCYHFLLIFLCFFLSLSPSVCRYYLSSPISFSKLSIYFSLSVTTIPDYLSAGLMTMLRSFNRSVKARLSFFVKSALCLLLISLLASLVCIFGQLSLPGINVKWFSSISYSSSFGIKENFQKAIPLFSWKSSCWQICDTAFLLFLRLFSSQWNRNMMLFKVALFAWLLNLFLHPLHLSEILFFLFCSPFSILYPLYPYQIQVYFNKTLPGGMCRRFIIFSM